ncbi:MAG TPA: hypothetical protein VIJ18_18165 [Microbacteriaceae bacterium]
MNAADYALSLMAEAVAHGVTILYGNREIGLSTMRSGIGDSPEELLDELDLHANEIWAILHHYRQHQNGVAR